MVSWVNAILKAHKTRENVQDGETRQERHNDLPPIQIEIEHKRSELEKVWELKLKKLEVMLKTRSED
ncbi:hypothetical protein L916_06729 [Phytophthora nicotianae]|uniref:PH domain-containing protein n=1 Tax=Phytophthora nicotianae TaxID=4792 RepID=W2J7P4_PHYNI|nr:hypothetical protein L916_06729 [Phytophthora nicotianae]